ncbi:MAG: hypothetical protein Q8S26_14505 [Azonexus sp.]|nr:hypothetical protein [Azonexus sp.]
MIETRFSLLRQRGVSIIAAIFILLLLSALAAMMASLTVTSNVTSTQDFQGSRAYQAARAGVEWGLYTVMQDPANASPASATSPLAGCFAATTINAIPGFAVSVSCVLNPAAGNYQEGTRNIRIYQITATATANAAGPGGSVQRQIVVTAEKCRDTSVSSAPFDC